MRLTKRADDHTLSDHNGVLLPYTVRSSESSVALNCMACEWFRWEAR